MPTESNDGYPILLWWAECVDLLSLLTPHNRAQVLSLLADGVRMDTGLPDQEANTLPPSGRLLDCAPCRQASARTWRSGDPGQKVRIIG